MRAGNCFGRCGSRPRVLDGAGCMKGDGRVSIVVTVLPSGVKTRGGEEKWGRKRERTKDIVVVVVARDAYVIDIYIDVVFNVVTEKTYDYDGLIVITFMIDNTATV